MRALVVRQPFASLIADGEKTLEIRTWQTSYRGPLLIVAGVADHPLREAHASLPRGVALCVVELSDVRRAVPGVDDAEARAYVSPGLWAWVLDDPRPTRRVRVRGLPGLFTVTSRSYLHTGSRRVVTPRLIKA